MHCIANGNLFRIGRFDYGALLRPAYVAVAMLVMSLPARSEQTIASLPTEGQRPDGFTLSVQIPDSSQVGICPAELTVKPVGPVFSADRRLTIELMPRDAVMRPSTYDYRYEIQLAEGTNQFTRTLQIPVHYEWLDCRVRVLEDGLPLAGYDASATLLRRFKRINHAFTIGVIEARTTDTNPPDWQRFPDLRLVQLLYGLSPGAAEFLSTPQSAEPELSHQQAKRFMERSSGMGVQYRQMSEDRLPEHWSRYNELDVLIASHQMLQRIKSENPSRWDAIRQWIACGGMLWTYGDQPAASVNPLFDSDVLDWQPPEDDVGRTNSARFTFLDAEREGSRKQSYADAREAMQLVSSPLVPQGDANAGLISGDLREPRLDFSQARKQLLFANYLSGRVMYLQKAYPFPGSEALWNASFAVSQTNLGTSNKLGSDLIKGDNNFWRWLIEDVGKPPVYTFVGVITLFVLLVGPASYYVFYYLRRLYMFFVFAPVMAFVCTVGIGVYAIWGDGFGTLARIRCLTVLNDAGDGTTWTRQTYFCGLRPRDGAVWNRDWAVYPLFSPPSTDDRLPDATSQPVESRIVQTDTETRFDGQFIPSRKQVQFLANRPINDVGTLAATGEKDSFSVRNNSSFDFSVLLFADANGDMWKLSDFPSGAVADAEAMHPVEASREITSIYISNAPELPIGYEDASRNRWLTMGRQPRKKRPTFISLNDGGIAEAYFRKRLLEASNLGEGAFVAVAELPDDAIAIEGGVSAGSIHLVLGPINLQGDVTSPFNGIDLQDLPPGKTP